MVGPPGVTKKPSASKAPQTNGSKDGREIRGAAGGVLTVTASVRSSPAVEGSSVSDVAGSVSVFVIVLPSSPASTVPSRVKVADAPLASDGIVQLPPENVPAVAVPLLPVAVRPKGNVSLSATFAAASGPLLVTVISKATVSPTDGVALEPAASVFVVTRSASGVGTIAVTRKLSYPADSSFSS